jgi:hypothetical protein
METSPYPIASSATALQTMPRQRPRFGAGFGDMVSSGIGVIDSNRLIELFASDGLGMVFPRTALALSMRGPDDARETFIREMTGLISNVFMVGWASMLMMQVAGQHKHFYNPKAMPGKAWVNAGTLEAFGNLYTQALNRVKVPGREPNPAEIRQEFVKLFLQGLASGDRQFNLVGRLRSYNQLQQKETAQEATRGLKKLLDEISPKEQRFDWHGVTKGSQDPQTQLSRTLEHLAELQKKDPHWLEQFPRWGRLPDSRMDAFIRHYDIRHDARMTTLDTHDFNQYAENALEKTLKQKQRHDPKFHDLIHFTPPSDPSNPHTPTERTQWKQDLKARGFHYDDEFAKVRLTLSKDRLREASQDFANHMDKESLLSGLTDTINLYDPAELKKHGNAAKPLIGGKNRKALFLEAKHFLEQYVDRATYEATEMASPRFQPDRWYDEVQRKLFNHQPGFWHNLVPHLEDGFVVASMKAKRLFTAVPFILTISFATGMTFYNNYITMKKHGGRIFFPGEGMPPPEAEPKAPPTSLLQAAASPNSPPLGAMASISSLFPSAAPINASAVSAGLSPAAFSMAAAAPTFLSAIRHTQRGFSQFQRPLQGSGGLVS